MKILMRMDGRGYKSYKLLLKERYKIGRINLSFRKIQSDPFAPPSVLEIVTPNTLKGYPQVALEDLLHRVLYKNLRKVSKKRGEGRSGEASVPRPSNSILKRSSVKVTDENIAVRINVGLPSRRRRILATEAIELIESVLKAFNSSLSDLKGSIEEHSKVYLVFNEIRNKLGRLKLVAFVGNGSILPRACHYCEEPLKGAVPFESPTSMKVEIETKFGVFEGMGVPKGVTTVIGPAFHGKTTLLEALAKSIWPHVKGDGRELVVTSKDFVYVRSEDGRVVKCVDVRSFIELPNSDCFTTLDASGATSVAASFQEAVEVGSNVIAIDEDYTATNFLFLDPIIGKLYRTRTIRTLSEQLSSIKDKGISVLLIANASSQVLVQSDKVIYMENYSPEDLTERVKNEIDVNVNAIEYSKPSSRIIEYVPPKKLKRRGLEIISPGWSAPLDFHTNPHIVEEAQVEFIAKFLSKKFSGKLSELDLPHPWDLCVTPNCSEVRTYEIAYALNRCEGIRVMKLTNI
ncbi:ABC-ATPase domain-containing protein [Ignicoccus islandicus]|nr:ABC-ATPase domain-containing protein [Ignicoccus islandicus]